MGKRKENTNALLNAAQWLGGFLRVYPDKLQRALKGQDLTVQLKKNSIHLDDVLAWEKWSKSAEIIAYIAKGNDFSVFSTEIKELSSLTKTTILPRHKIDIRQIEGLSSSRADLSRHRDIKAITKDHARVETIISLSNLKDLLVDVAENIFNPKSLNHIKQHAWDGRLLVSNSDGSHRIAAANLIASELNEVATIRSDLHLIQIDPDTLSRLSVQFDMFLLPSDDIFFNRITKSLEHDLISHYRGRILNRTQSINLYVYFFPRDSLKSRLAINVLRNAGAFSLNNYFSTVADNQDELAKKWLGAVA